MSAYSFAIFFHIVGVLGLFAGIAVEQVVLASLGRAITTEQLRDWVRPLQAMRRVEGPSVLAIVATGIYMTVTRWGLHPWLTLALLGMVAMAAIGGAVTERRMKAIVSEIPSGDGPIAPALRLQLRDPVLRTASALRAALGVWIVFEMSVKPDAVGALAALGIALALGVVAAAPRRAAAQRATRFDQLEKNS